MDEGNAADAAKACWLAGEKDGIVSTSQPGRRNNAACAALCKAALAMWRHCKCKGGLLGKAVARAPFGQLRCKEVSRSKLGDSGVGRALAPTGASLADDAPDRPTSCSHAAFGNKQMLAKSCWPAMRAPCATPALTSSQLAHGPALLPAPRLRRPVAAWRGCRAPLQCRSEAQGGGHAPGPKRRQALLALAWIGGCHACPPCTDQ